MNSRHGTHVILKTIAPDVSAASADELEYSHLVSSRKYFDYPQLLFRNGAEIIKHRKGYITSKAHEDMQIATLLMAAHRLHVAWTPPMKLFWSAQLTTRSVALFGKPLSKEVARLAARELHFFEAASEKFNSHQEFFGPVLNAYRSLTKKTIKQDERGLEERYRPVLDIVKRYFFANYPHVLAYFGRYDSDSFLSPDELYKSFSAALDVLSSDDAAWKKWQIVMDDSAKLCVDVSKHSIVIGKQRAPVPAREVRGLFAHEVLVHAQRAMRGAKLGQELAIGLPGYLTAEEGLGVLVESAINGGISRKVKDRYVDIALALGSGLRRPLTRLELFQVCYAREVIRNIVSGEDVSLATVEAQVWEHVNRIYRGSLGNQYVGVFTKDVAYYKGFVAMAKYVQKSLKKESIDSIIEYVLQGKFDPRKEAHTQFVHRS